MKTMQKQETAKTPSRRDFFKTASLGAGAAAIGAVGLGAAPKAATAVASTGAGYRESEHVKRYYELAKI